jgi:hypothetical protein
MRTDDTDTAGRVQMTLRVERDLLDAIDDLAREERVDRAELARRFLADGLARERVDVAVADYSAGRRSAWAAAEKAGVSLYEMLDHIAEVGVPYRIDPEVLSRFTGPGSDDDPGPTSAPIRALSETQDVEALRAAFRPDRVRLLLVGESSPAGATHFYLANSILFRATRDAIARGLGVATPPSGEAFLDWFRELGGWLVDVADQPVNKLPDADRTEAVDAGVARLAGVLADTRPTRLVVVLRRIAGAVRAASGIAGYDETSIDVVPFPVRQWRPVYVDQLAEIARQTFVGSGVRSTAGHAAREQPATYASAGEERADTLHVAIADVLEEHPGVWMRASAIAREIAERDLWRRPSDGAHPPGSQISARVRRYPELFQTSDLGIRLRMLGHPRVD